MKKILFVSTVSWTLSVFLAPFAKHYRALGWDVDGMANGVADAIDCQNLYDHVYEIKLSRNPFKLSNLFRVPSEIRRVIREGRYDLVHVHTPVAAFVTRFSVRRENKASRPVIIYTAHGFHFHKGGNIVKNSVFLWLEKLAGPWTDHLVVINDEDRNAASKFRIVPDDSIHYIPGIGIDTQEYIKESVCEKSIQSVRNDLSMNPSDVLFLVIGEINPNKRPEDILRAFAALAGANTHLAFAGNGPLMGQMKRLTQELGVESRVHFLGFRRDIPILIRTSSAVILPSRREGLPRSIMEALCLEVPCVGSDIRGNRDLIEGGCGFLVKAGDIGGYCEALRWILNHPELSRKMGERGRSKMHAYDLQKVIRMHDDLYEEAFKIKESISHNGGH